MCVYLYTKFQVSNIILTSFRQGGKFPPSPSSLPPSPQKNTKKPTQIRVKLLTTFSKSSILDVWQGSSANYISDFSQILIKDVKKSFTKK